MIITTYNVFYQSKYPRRIALIADLHNRNAESLLKILKKTEIDYIVVNGDILYSVMPGSTLYEYVPGSAQNLRNSGCAKVFLQEASKIAPILFSIGNHELYLDAWDKKMLDEFGVTLLDNSYIIKEDLVFGGLSSPYNVLAGTGKAKRHEDHERRWKMIFDSFDYSWLPDFCNQKGFKILLSHHPEIYEQHLKKLNGIDLILSGHAHGGQIRLFGHGLYAHGQGWFPKYTGGMYDGKLIVSRGLSNTSRIPRIGNPTELVYIDLIPIK